VDRAPPRQAFSLLVHHDPPPYDALPAGAAEPGAALARTDGDKP
jgi:hypothetical protein